MDKRARRCLITLLAALLPAAAQAQVGSVTMTSLSTGSFSVSWAIGALSSPTVVLSGDNFATTISSAQGALGQGATAYANLVPNTTYWFQVKHATETDAAYASFNASRSTVTYARQPAAGPVGGVGAATLTASWTSNGNPAGTLYVAQVSTDGFTTLVSSETRGLSATFFGLLPNTTHQLRVKARGHGGAETTPAALADTATLANPPGAAAPSAVGESQLTANWTTSGNPAGTRYRVELDDDPAFGSINAASVTANGSAVFSGLVPNTTYHMRVEALNVAGAGSGVTALASTSTLAAPPGAAAVSGVGPAALRANWTANGNGPGARYVVVLSTGAAPESNGFAGNQSSGTLNSFADFAGLSANTTYYLAVRAVNNNGLSSAYTQLGSTITWPAAPGSAAPSGVAVSQLTLNWTSGGNPAGTRYVAQLDDDPGFGSIDASSDTLNVFAALTGLAANTTWYARVRAFNAAGTGSGQTSLPATATLAAPPAAAAYSSVAGSSLQANWTAGGNPAGTRYEVILSTGANPSTNGFSGNLASATANTSAVFSGLAPGTAYHAEVRAVGHGGAATAYTALGSTTTIALLAPSGLAAQVHGVSSVTWSWSNVAGETGFRVVGPGDANLSGDLAADTLSWLETGLSTNTAYQRRVVSLAGAAASTSTAVTAYTLAAPPTGLAATQVGVSSAVLSWSAAGNPAGTQYRLERWTAGGATTTLTVTASSAAVTALSAASTYYFQVRALNGDGVQTAASAQAALVTLPTPESQGAVSPDQPATIVFQAPAGEVRVEVPVSAFAQAVTVTVSNPPGFPADTALNVPLRGLGVGAEITAGGAQPRSDVLLTINYTDASAAAFDETRLLIARYDATRALWVPLPSAPDPAGNRVTARTNHFSTFQVMQAAPQAALIEPRIFPNPMRPARGHTFTMLTNLPAGARLRIYTYAGELVRDLSAGAGGVASWDGRNSAGQAVASGVYVVHIQGGGSSATAKVAVER